MLRISAFVLALFMALLSPAYASETGNLPPYEEALPLYNALLSSDTFYNFENIPDETLAREVVYRLRQLLATPAEALTDEDIYRMVFKEGAYVPAPEEISYLDPLPMEIAIENAVESGNEKIIVSLRVEKDFGFGMELWGYVDIHILPDENAPYGAYVTRVFIPE